MRLKRLEVQGFKSFMEKTVIAFDQGITGIVGPNGSGKSNIGDAVRWVLGEQSARVLRGSKMEDVIFNGTQKRKRASFCEVSLIFENEDHALKSAFAEVAVTRRVFRNGDSEYYLNKTACRLRDILELFRDTGIGREGYSLIGQGRIDEILSQKSEDRRQVFEEAAGIMTFRVRKEEAERKLQRTGENLTRVYDILSELENRLGPLSEQAAVAKEYQELFSRLKELEINIFLLRYDKVKERVGALSAMMDGLSDVLLSYEARLNEINQKREALDKEIEALENSLTEARREQNDKTEALHESELTRDRLSAKLEALYSADAQEEAQRLELEERRSLLCALNQEDGQAEQARGEALAAKRSALQITEKELADAAKTAGANEEALNSHKADILSAVNRLSDARERQTRQQTIRAQMLSRIEEVEKSLFELTESRRAPVSRLAAAKLEKEKTQARFALLCAEVRKTEAELNAGRQKAGELSREAQALNLSVQGDLSRRRLMEEMSRDMEGYQQAVKRALEFSRGDARVRGVLARLMSVPKELETAVDMVLGGALQNIVTTDEDAAKRVIDHLRQNRLGRATFLPITTVRARVLSMQERQLLSMPGCLGVLSELIEFDESYRGVIENLLGRTILADTLEHGIPIMRAGRQAFRLVTLAGDVMHSGGSMTGGTAQGRAVSLLGREREIKELREQTEKKRARLSELQAELERVTADCETLKAAQEDALHAVHQEEIAVARETERLHNAEAELSAHDDRIKRTKEAKEQLTESVNALSEDLKQAEFAAETVSVDREAMDSKTESLQRTLFESRQAVEALREKFSEMQLSFSDETHALDTLKRDRARRADELSNAEKGIERLSANKEERAAQQAELKRRLIECEADSAALKSEAASQSERVSSLESERLAKAALQRELIKLSDETHRMYDEDSAKQHRTELALTKAQGELTQMCEHILSAYDLTYAGAEELRSAEPFDLPKGEKEAASLRARIRELGMVNVAAIEEYTQEKERFDALAAQRDDLLKAKEDLETLISRLLKQMEKVFVAEFEKLGAYFSVTFTRLFGGGQAELKLSEPDNPLECGIEIIAQPPGKKLQLLSLLSGGERALTAIAILFAMLKLKPTPFCILDEIEAALDEANITYFADYLAEYKATTQFVVVTHRKGTMERCDALYGVAMEERGVSRMVSVNLQDYQT